MCGAEMFALRRERLVRAIAIVARAFPALNALANNKTAEETIKKRAKETMVAITRRLNTAAARKASPASRPATQPSA